jgi:hypothetical protein
MGRGVMGPLGPAAAEGRFSSFCCPGRTRSRGTCAIGAAGPLHFFIDIGSTNDFFRMFELKFGLGKFEIGFGN